MKSSYHSVFNICTYSFFVWQAYHPGCEPPSSSSVEPLPMVIEELASMVAVSGEELEDIARDRNKMAPELKYVGLFFFFFSGSFPIC